MLRDLWRVVPLICSSLFLLAAAATVGLLVRAEWTRGANGKRRLQGARGKSHFWPEPTRIPLAGRRYERAARWTALLAVVTFALALFALSTQ